MDLFHSKGVRTSVVGFFPYENKDLDHMAPVALTSY
jgi:hypothetical protein